MEEEERRHNDDRRQDSMLGLERETLREVSQVKTDVAVLKTEIVAISEDVQKLITRHEFAPVKLIAYGLATSVLAAVLAAVLSLVIRHST